MADLISAQKLFEKLMERSKRFTDSRRYTLQAIGEKALEDKEIPRYDRESVAIAQARIDEIDEIVKIMQALARES